MKMTVKNDLKKALTTPHDKDINPLMVSNIATMYDDLNDTEFKSFNREVLKSDLCWFKYRIKRLKEINGVTKSLINELDKYFDVICPMAGFDSVPFKHIIRKLMLEGN